MNTLSRSLGSVRVKNGFWRQKADVVWHEMLPYQWRALNDLVPGAEPSHAVENFRIAAGEAQGTFQGTIFQDSDVGKWLEAASYALADHDDATLEANVDEAIRLIAKAQQDDGYINTWFTITAPDKRWTDLAWGHELYCGGHLIEAAVAHFHSTGSRRFLDVMVKYARGLLPLFGEGGSREGEACGHPEIELALHRLADATGDEAFRQLAHRFVDVRGTQPEQFYNKKPLGFEIPFNDWFKPDYFVAHRPVRDQHKAEGHAVRAVYLYTAMARQAQKTGDARLKAVLAELWTSVVEHQQYITGSIGSHAMGERFSRDYDLPPDTAYNETCAAIGFIFWAQAMLKLDPRGTYADGIERALYNGVLSGMALDGTRFFYVNPLEVVPAVARRRQDLEHVKTERVAWFGCSCCPPNIARLVGSIASYAWATHDNTVRIDQYVDSEAHLDVGGAVGFALTTRYPWDGSISVSVSPEVEHEFELSLRIPGWCTSFTLSVNQKPVSVPVLNGYVTLKRVWAPGDQVQLELAMPVRLMTARPEVAELAGRVAVTRGPLVFCAEEIDNGADLQNLVIDPTAPTSAHFFPGLMGGSVKVTLEGRRRRARATQALYSPWEERSEEKIEVVLVPYHQWGNRKPGQEMRVWLRASED